MVLRQGCRGRLSNLPVLHLLESMAWSRHHLLHVEAGDLFEILHQIFAACSCPVAGCAQPVTALLCKTAVVLHIPVLHGVKLYGSLAAELCDLQTQRGVDAAPYTQRLDRCRTLLTGTAQERQAGMQAMQGKPPALAHPPVPFLQELRVRGSYLHHKQIKAAQGVKIAAPGLEHAVAGTQMLIVGPDDDVEALKDEAMEDMQDIFSSVDRSGGDVGLCCLFWRCRLTLTAALCGGHQQLSGPLR